MPTNHRVTLYREDDDGVPVITPSSISKGQYDKVLEVIFDVQKVRLGENKPGMKYQR